MPNGHVAKLLEDAREFLTRRHFTLPPEIRRSNRLAAALEAITARWPDAAGMQADTEKPIFIFSAGWRSGSTLLQRLVMSGGQAIVWGEPLGDTAIIPRLAGSMDIIGRDWPPGGFFPADTPAGSLSGEWIANLTPELHSLRDAHRSFFLSWLRDPASDAYGTSRWGLKEVRLTMDHARYFHWLFPQAKFLFICRNPFDSFRSWKGNRWRSHWPGYYRNSATAFARHWSRLLGGYLEGHREVGGMLIRFEDLTSGKYDLEELAGYLELDHLRQETLGRRIRTPNDKASPVKRNLSVADRFIISMICGPLMKQLRYR